MNKSELINKVRPAGASAASTELVIDSLVKVVQEELGKGGEVTLPGLGKFSVAERAARTGRNPRTGETLEIKAKRVPTFSAAKALKDAAKT